MRFVATCLRRARPAVWIAIPAVALAVTDLGGRVLATNDEARIPPAALVASTLTIARAALLEGHRAADEVVVGRGAAGLRAGGARTPHVGGPVTRAGAPGAC